MSVLKKPSEIGFDRPLARVHAFLLAPRTVLSLLPPIIPNGAVAVDGQKGNGPRQYQAAHRRCDEHTTIQTALTRLRTLVSCFSEIGSR